jgi:hypothetical protein
MIEKSSINSDLSLYLLSYSRCSHIKHFYIDRICLWSVVSIIEKSRKYQKNKIRRKKKERISFKIFNRYWESRSILNENDANLIQKVFAKRELFESTSHERKAISVAKKSNNSNLQRRYHLYKFCKCYFVDWSLCSRRKFSKYFFSTITILRSF